MKAIFKKLISKFVLKNFPFDETTKVHIDHYDTVYVKKGKVREWRTFKDGVRQQTVLK
jgi:hypothetical protein